MYIYAINMNFALPRNIRYKFHRFHRHFQPPDISTHLFLYKYFARYNEISLLFSFLSFFDKKKKERRDSYSRNRRGENNRRADFIASAR